MMMMMTQCESFVVSGIAARPSQHSYSPVLTVWRTVDRVTQTRQHHHLVARPSGHCGEYRTGILTCWQGMVFFSYVSVMQAISTQCSRITASNSSIFCENPPHMLALKKHGTYCSSVGTITRTSDRASCCRL